MTIRSFAILCVSLLAAQAVTAAENQTVESAQKFLSMTMVNQKWGEAIYENTSDKSLSNYADGVIVSFVPTGRCKQQMIADFPAYKHPYADLTWSEYRLVQTYDFSELVEVRPGKTSKNLIEVFFRGQPRGIPLKIASEELATRVAFALAFLKFQCDGTAATGF